MVHKVRDGHWTPEKSDGCTIISKPYNWLTGKQLPFRDCCLSHDKDYWYGGPKHLRTESDKRFRECVAAHGYPILAWIFWVAIRIGGSPRLPLPWRWARHVTIIEGALKGYAAGNSEIQKENQ